MRALAVLFVIVGAIGGQSAFAVGNTAAVPVLVELFTSEGCSSCPPADALLERMDSSQPIPGEHLIVLSEHVDYWDHDGWKDPFSSAALTDRQGAYARKLGLAEVYTPQFIVDGTTELRANDRQAVAQIFQKALTPDTVPLRIGSVSTEARGVARVHVEADGTSAQHDADIYIALALDHAESQVLRGENGGRRLSYVAVVQSLTKVGRLKKGTKFDQDVPVKLHSDTDPKNVRVIVFVQDPGPGKVLGAASEGPSDAGSR